MNGDLEGYRARLDALAGSAAGRTDAALAAEVAEVTRLSPAEIGTLVPDAEDARRLGELVAALGADADRDARRDRLVRDVERYAGPILAVLERLVKG